MGQLFSNIQTITVTVAKKMYPQFKWTVVQLPETDSILVTASYFTDVMNSPVGMTRYVAISEFLQNDQHTVNVLSSTIDAVAAALIHNLGWEPL